MKGVANLHGVPITILDWLRTCPGTASLVKAYGVIVDLWKQERIGVVADSARRHGDHAELCRIWEGDLEELINRIGLSGIDASISDSNFPPAQTAEEMKFWSFHLDFRAERDEVIKVMATAGYRPATVIEFLSWLVFKAGHNVGIDHSVVALGQVWNESVVKICKAGGGGLCLAREYLSRPFDPDFRFLGVRLKEGEQPVDFQI